MPPRLPIIDMFTANADQKAALIEWRADRRATNPPEDVWAMLVASPEGMRRVAKLGAFCRFHTSLPDLPREAAVYLVATHGRDQLETRIHGQKLAELGLDPGALESLRAGQTDNLPDGAREAAQFARAMLVEGEVAQTVFDAAHRAFGDQGTVELAITVSYYDMLARLRRVFAPDGDSVAPPSSDAVSARA